MSKVGLVLEGGGMRGMYTAGVIDTFIKNNINVDLIVGVSAGALFGANYFSQQEGRAIRYNKKYCNDRRYISIYSLLTTGNIINKDFAYYKVSESLDKFDDKTFKKTNKDYYAVVTNCTTGEAEYINIKDGIIKNMEVLRATSAMPFVSKMIDINSNKYLDGALADSIPFQKCLELGCDKVIVVLTRDLNYKKKPYNKFFIKFIKQKYKDYPKLIEKIINRYDMYNIEVENLKKLEKNNEILVIRPSEELRIKRLERSKAKLQETYDLGVKDTLRIIDDIKKYLN